MITLQNISKYYGSHKVIKDLNLSIEEGCFLTLLGPSGCGKSSTLKIINRLIEPSNGDVFVDGENTKNYSPTLLRRKIGYTMQNNMLFPHWTVEKNIATVPKLLKWNPKRINERIHELLDICGMEPEKFLNKYPSQLSGGQQQRVSVARALAADPKILLMDEPFGALDPLTRQTLQNELLNIQKRVKKTIVFVTHDISEAVKLSSHIAIMNKGMLVQHDLVKNILLKPATPFVEELISPKEKGLLLLSNLQVKDRMKYSIETFKGEHSIGSIKQRALETGRRIWTIDEFGHPLGYISPDPRLPNFVSVSKEVWLTEEHPLREALSLLIWREGRAAPVVNDKGILIGDIGFPEIVPSHVSRSAYLSEKNYPPQKGLKQ